MIAKLVAIGDGKAVYLPNPILEECLIDDDVEIEIKKRAIIIRSLSKKPRIGWEQAFQVMHQHGDDALLIDDGLDWGEWE